MAKITRFNGNLKAFGADATGLERTIYGDVAQSDDLTANMGADFQRGWGILATGAKPPKQYFNGALYSVSQVLAYLHQAGIPEWNVSQEYYASAGACSHNGDVWIATADNTASEPTAVNADWRGLLSLIDENVVGPASSVDNRIATFDGITGELIKDGGKTIAEIDTLYDDTDVVKAPSGVLPVLDGGNLTNVSSVAGIDDLTDVDTSTVAPNLEDGLVWNGVNWVPGVVAGESVSDLDGGGATTLYSSADIVLESGGA